VTGASPKAATVDWHALLQALDLRGPARQLADHCELGSVNGGVWQLVLPPDKAHLNTPQVRARLETALSEQQRRDVRVNVIAGQPSRPTPADLRRASENERMRAARVAIEDDPNVKAVQAAFGAVVEPDSIRSTK
jgi:DNA polymerase-3 subunit gamma/tau